MLALKALGFEIALYKTPRTPEEIKEAIQEIEAQRPKLPYEIDWVVFCVNKLALHQELGYTSHHPRFRLAFKFGRDRGETTVENIIWETSRSGRVCPTMVVKPIPLGGATVTNCTVHNAKTVKAVGLKKGDKVLLEREVIPYFVQKVSPEPAPSETSLPKTCPSCGSELTWDETETQLVCLNQGGCVAQLQDYLEHYCSRGVTNIMGVGPELLRKLMEKNLLKSPADLYTLTPQQILDNVERQGERSAQKAVDSIQSHREQTLETFLSSLGIRGLGPSVAQRLVNHFGTLDAILKATPEEMLNVEGVAETMSETLTKGLKERSTLIGDLMKHVKLIEAVKSEGPLTGSTFCLTGHVEFDFEGQHYDARPDIEALIKSKGGTIKSVSKGLSYLVAGDEAGSKLEKAKKANIPVIDANGLLNLLAGKK
jgi:DNA ligase (NAD+)